MIDIEGICLIFSFGIRLQAITNFTVKLPTINCKLEWAGIRCLLNPVVSNYRHMASEVGETSDSAGMLYSMLTHAARVRRVCFMYASHRYTVTDGFKSWFLK